MKAKFISTIACAYCTPKGANCQRRQADWAVQKMGGFAINAGTPGWSFKPYVRLPGLAIL